MQGTACHQRGTVVLVILRRRPYGGVTRAGTVVRKFLQPISFDDSGSAKESDTINRYRSMKTREREPDRKPKSCRMTILQALVDTHRMRANKCDMV